MERLWKDLYMDEERKWRWRWPMMGRAGGLGGRRRRVVGVVILFRKDLSRRVEMKERMKKMV